MITFLERPEIRGHLRTATLRARARRLLTAQGRAEADLCVLLTDDEELRGLNAQWRGLDRPTDVLSFGQPALGGPLILGGHQVLGDVAISVEMAIRQAGEGCLPRIRTALGVTGHADISWGVQEEVTFLMLHGVLHLCGHDHETGPEAERMEGREAELLPWLLNLRRRLPPPDPWGT